MDGGRLMEWFEEIMTEFPVIYFYAISTAKKKDDSPMGKFGKDTKGDAHQEKKDYNWPIYKYARRNDKYLITRIYLKWEPTKEIAGQAQSSRDNQVQKPEHWKRRGVALLASKE